MIETHLNVFDAVVLGIMALSCLFAFFRGLVREVLSLAAWIGAGVVTIYYFPQVAAKLTPHFKSPMVAAGMATLGLYIGALACFGLINMILLKSIKRGETAGTLDNLLGLVFGALRGALIISLGFFLLTLAIPDKQYPKWITESVTAPYAEKGALMLVKMAPDYLKEISSLQKKATEELRQQTQQPMPTGQTQALPQDVPSDNGEGYSNRNLQQLNRLIDSTGSNR